MTRRAILARLCPRFTSGSSWVSRILTMANSAATKKPLRKTRSTTTRRFKTIWRVWSILKFHLAKNDLQNFFEPDQAEFAAIARGDDGDAVTAALHAPKRFLHPHVFVEIQWRGEMFFKRLT